MFAGFRACKCLEGFYRTHMFMRCKKCQHNGLECKDDYAILKAGYWWKWTNDTHKHSYTQFTENLMKTLPALDSFSIQHPYLIPEPHKCPREDSCKGGLDSTCEAGYEGPLCEVCGPGYYKQFQTCKQCPSRKWMVAQLSITGGSLLVIVAVLFFMNKRNKKKANRRPLVDILLSRLKIVIGFYQVTSGLLEAFTYIKWPGSLQVIAKYSKVFQLNILQIAPLHCILPGLHINAFGTLFAIMSLNGAAVGLSGFIYGIRKVIILKIREDKETWRRISQTKELLYRNLFFFLYVTYLSTCSNTANVLPFACRKLCENDKDEVCHKYLKADYSIQCHDTKYNQLVIMAFISTAYVVALPAVTFFTLWKHRKIIFTTNQDQTSQISGSEMITGLRFLFENYKPECWYWELVEVVRKVILTSGLILVGEESRAYICLTCAIAGLYGVLFASVSPIRDVFENRMMITSLSVTFVNLCIGAASRIPTENIVASIDTYVDTVIFKTFVIGANTLVIGLLLGKIFHKRGCYLC